MLFLGTRNEHFKSIIGRNTNIKEFINVRYGGEKILNCINLGTGFNVMGRLVNSAIGYLVLPNTPFSRLPSD